MTELKLTEKDFLNPSKGIQCYTYNCVPGCSVELSVPGQPPLVKSGLKQFTIDHLEIERQNTSLPYFSGIFRCRVLQRGREVFNKWVEINSITGNLGQGTMKTLVDQTSVINNNVCVTHCFYDAPSKGNTAGLPDWDQFSVTVSPNNSSWMSIVAPIGSTMAGKPFRRLVLAAAHDVGMNSLLTSETILQRVGPAFTEIVESIVPVSKGLDLPDIFKGPLIPNVIQSSSITQKDELSTILAIGARYFEFRPAYLNKSIRDLPQLQDIKDELYFMHGPIPGMAYDDFLGECINFLVHNPAEIMVVHLRWDGVPAECERPTPDDLKSSVDHALKGVQGGLQAGNLQDMKLKSINDLRKAGKRLIIIQDVDNYNIYSDQANATLTGDSIITQFNAISAAKQNGKAFTNIQCQATATNLGLKIWFSAISATASNSWLLATKAICDSKTIPWVRDNALAKLSKDQLLVVMDDFVDGAMCEVAKDLSVQRLKKP